MRIRLHNMQSRLTTVQKCELCVPLMHRRLTVQLVFGRLTPHSVLGSTHDSITTVQPFLQVVSDTIAEELKHSSVDGRMDEKLFVHEDDHVLYSAENLCLYSRGAIGLTKTNERSQHIYTRILGTFSVIRQGLTILQKVL